MTVQTAAPPVLDDQEVIDALRGLRVAQQRLDDARRGLTDAKDRIAVALHHAATPYRAPGAPIPQEVIAHLYWERDEIRARDIADAFRLPVSHLGRIAGPRTAVAACQDCAAATEVVRRTRSDQPRAACEDCRRRREIELELQRLEEEGRQALERQTWERDGWDPYAYEPPYGRLP